MNVDENRLSPSSEEWDVHSLMNTLSALEGTWKGRGSGIYPTIDDFTYAETLHFTLDKSY